MKKTGFVALGIATFTYSTVQVLDKAVLNSKVDSGAYAITRVFVSMLFLAGFLLLQNKQKISAVFKKQYLKDLIIIGVLASGLGLLLQIIGLAHTSATNMSIILTFAAPLTSIFAWMFLKEKITKFFVLASVLMLVGSFIILYKPVTPVGFGDALVFLAVLGFAFSNVYAKRTMKNIPTEIVTFGRLFFGSLSLALLMPFFHFDFNSLMNVPFWVGLSGMIFAVRMVTYYKGIEIEGSAVAATFLLFCPVVTIVLANLFLGESFNAYTVVGLVSILAGGFFLTRKPLNGV